jgi:hypothetical protein
MLQTAFARSSMSCDMVGEVCARTAPVRASMASRLPAATTAGPVMMPFEMKSRRLTGRG